MSEETKNKPIKKFRRSNVELVYWENEMDNGKKFVTVEIQRHYVDKEGQRQTLSCGGFTKDDMNTLVGLSQRGNNYFWELDDQED